MTCGIAKTCVGRINWPHNRLVYFISPTETRFVKDSLDACVMLAVLAGIEFDVVVLAPELADAGVVDVAVVVDDAVVHGCDSAKRHIV